MKSIAQKFFFFSYAPRLGLEESSTKFWYFLGVNTVMKRRTVNLVFSLAPAPLFLLGMSWSLSDSTPICGAGSYEMTVMWLVMALAHVTPWLAWYQQRDLQKFQILPDKQQ